MDQATIKQQVILDGYIWAGVWGTFLILAWIAAPLFVRAITNVSPKDKHGDTPDTVSIFLVYLFLGIGTVIALVGSGHQYSKIWTTDLYMKTSQSLK